MRHHLALALLLTVLSTGALMAAQEVPSAGNNLGSVSGGDFKSAHLVIDMKCTSCHTAKVIEEAMASGKDMLKIQQRMEQKGVKLNSNEHSVLGIFWKETPLKKLK